MTTQYQTFARHFNDFSDRCNSSPDATALQGLLALIKTEFKQIRIDAVEQASHAYRVEMQIDDLYSPYFDEHDNPICAIPEDTQHEVWDLSREMALLYGRLLTDIDFNIRWISYRFYHYLEVIERRIKYCEEKQLKKRLQKRPVRESVMLLQNDFSLAETWLANNPSSD